MSTCNRRMHWVVIAGLYLGACCPATWAKTWIVGAPNTPCPNATLTTISAAITAAQAGDVIEICPALYPEQLTITKPLTLIGITQDGVGRALVQPTSLAVANAQGFIAVVSVVNTSNVNISNLAIDASTNTVSGCSVALAGIHFYNASGVVESDAISGTQLSTPTSCTTLFPGNGFGVQADQTTGSTGPFTVAVRNTSIHDFGRNGILVNGSAESATISGNSITGLGPSTGVNQFGVFLANGATGQIIGNNITQGNCGAIAISNCQPIRSEGVVLRSAGDGVVIANNVINNVQAGVFVNGATHVQVIGNIVSSVDAYNGIHIQGSVSGLFAENRILHVGPLTTATSNDEAGCGINDISGTGSSGNNIMGNWVNDAYCGVGYVTGDRVEGNTFLGTLYQTLNGDNYPTMFPPAVEPGQPPAI
jgi:hypothetical protein